ncbi:hypothetical protein L484_015191 [Morus notabilis]|uniref:Uncharacterized protein n=1 Tax=Morus notabilis TaxID=981085 RepID=W9SB53_9ROSA|nr:hypothetical protein L484_015191 [Morus notabilis]
MVGAIAALFAYYLQFIVIGFNRDSLANRAPPIEARGPPNTVVIGAPNIKTAAIGAPTIRTATIGAASVGMAVVGDPPIRMAVVEAPPVVIA